MEKKTYLTVKELSRLTGFKEELLYKIIKERLVKHKITNNQYYIKISEWEYFCKKYLYKRAPKKTYKEIIRLLSKNKGNKILDIGSGSGFLAKKLNEEGFEVICCDQANYFMHRDIEFKRINLNNGLEHFNNETFDFVTCVEVIEHLENINFIIKEISRVLKPKGKAIITTPNIHHLQSRLLFLLKGELMGFRDGATDYTFQKFPHISPIYMPIFKKLIENHGFKITNISYNHGKIFLWKLKQHITEKHIGIPLPFKNKYFGETLIIEIQKT